MISKRKVSVEERLQRRVKPRREDDELDVSATDSTVDEVGSKGEEEHSESSSGGSIDDSSDSQPSV